MRISGSVSSVVFQPRNAFQAETRAKKSMLKSLVLALIKLYRMSAGLRQWFLPPVCRFHPTCSGYMHDAIETHGLRSGLGLGLKRLLRCHPLHPGGLDPVPERPLTQAVNQENPT